MKYKIIVDKQSRTNPSAEKKEYIIDIEELRSKGDTYDSLVITKDEDYVMRRLKLTEFYVLEELKEPIKETLENINIELFEGDNYIYLIDMTGNKFYAEYLIKNDFNDIYTTKSEMHSAIELTTQNINLSVNQKLQNYSTTEEMNGTINAKASEINAEVEKKVNEETITGAYLILKINGDTSESKLNADKIELSANDILNLLAGNAINLTTKNITISSNNFTVDKNGNMECNNGKFNGGEVILADDGSLGYEGRLRIVSAKGITGLYSEGLIVRKPGSSTSSISNNSIFLNMYDGKPQLIITGENATNFMVTGTTLQYIAENQGTGFYVDSGTKNAGLTDIKQLYVDGGITTPTLTQTSKAESKKNFEKFTLEEAKEILNNTDIYKYNLKTQDDKGKKHIGFVIGDDYNYSEEITSPKNDGANIYSMTSVLYTIVKEQQKAIDNLLKRVEALEAKK